ncbi:DNA-3-methyladenine glycosylase 2 family protein [Paenarthrobacter sp. Z7-10]|uniref:DNA-3-methyladenine glycosylase 2 family protein n=1 Tax=Paenarthrobacter sp. Z7-10 TaxID=2787635 RepID=UPI0022A94052|nr:Ada metal-binding domain-containing protein [Paenarthrobacter sp. Z7-10]MCZ2404317.1 DNA-3-methyladenine glycosylase 2 family protein [Paenarthrobacter sp. Z7-10]
MDFWQRYRAIESRDARFDGQFVTAVRSTGIYCRPSCPARTPKSSNVSFYQTSAAAHEAGYRACKRCLPEAVPGSPEWNLRSDLAGRAMRLIGAGALNRGGVAELAASLGYSTRQLDRILTSEVGAGPLALARATRAQTARVLLTATAMKLSDVAFAAGFGSIRQFNDTIGTIFALTPTQLRATAAPSTDQGIKLPFSGISSAPAPAATNLRLTLPFRQPFDPGIFEFLAARAVEGVEDGDGRHYSRSLALDHGDARFTVTWTGTRLELETHTEDLRDLPVLLGRVRRLLDLDADPCAIDAVLRSEPAMARRAVLVPGIRVPGAVQPEEMLIRAMIGQQITVAAARTALNQLASVGSLSRIATDTLYRQFPSPAQIAESGPELLRGPRRRIESVRAIAALLAEGGLEIGLADTPGSLSAKLLPLPGIGPWTVGYVAMRVLGAPDVFLANDAAIRNALAVLEGGPAAGAQLKPAAAVAYAARFSPWRSYATMQLWRAAARPPKSLPALR